MTTAWIGIDCGKHGAVAVIWPDGCVESWHVPAIETRTKRPRKKTPSGRPSYSTTRNYALNDMASLLSRIAVRAGRDDATEALVAIEQQMWMPNDGKRVVFEVGRGQGLWQMACAVAGLEFEMVKPKDWKPCYLPTGSYKAASLAAAKILYPDHELPLVKDEARAEALLIADYLMRTKTGQACPGPLVEPPAVPKPGRAKRKRAGKRSYGAP